MIIMLALVENTEQHGVIDYCHITHHSVTLVALKHDSAYNTVISSHCTSLRHTATNDTWYTCYRQTGKTAFTEMTNDI